MRIEKVSNRMGINVRTLVYDDKMGVSNYFLPKIYINFWSKERSFFLKTANGLKVCVTEEDLRRLNLKLIQFSDFTGRYECYMSINKPYKALNRIPLLSISKKLNKIWRGSINVEREYEKRTENGYLGWCPEHVN